MTAPTAPAPELGERKPDLRATEAAPAGPIESAAPLFGLGARGPVLAGHADVLTPAQVLGIQRAAGNAAVTGLLQRAPTDSPPKLGPKFKRRGRNPAAYTQPLSPPNNLVDAIDDMPWLVDAIAHVVKEDTARAVRKGIPPDIRAGSVSAAIIFARDAVFFFDGGGTLQSVESNLEGELKQDATIPPSKFKLPGEPQILVSEPTTKRTWRAMAELADEPPPGQEDDEDALPVIKAISLNPSDSKPTLPEGLGHGELVITVFMPWSMASWSKVPQPGSKADQGVGKELPPTPKDVPKWAKSQVSRVEKLIAQAQMATESEDVAGTGTGLQGTGPGGGGESSVPVAGGQAGRKGGAPDKGRGAGRSQQKGRAKPDRLVPWTTKDDKPMLNVWVGSSAQAIPLTFGESEDSLRQRVEEAAARQRSTGERLASGATETGFEGGMGGGHPTPEERAEATSTDATSMAFPSKIEMQGGSGAQVSPQGWATTVTGGRHNFDMKLDRNALEFGFTNQVLAAAQLYSYYWQVIDVTGLNVSAESQESAKAGTSKALEEEGRVEHAGRWSGVRAEAMAAAENAAEDIEADRPDFSLRDPATVWAAKASALAVEGISAGWDIAKAVISEIITKMTQPENRRKIGFSKPGEYVVRCLANPVFRGKRGERKATSISVFPVRVVDLDERALEVNLQEKGDIARLTRMLEEARAALAKNPDDPGAKARVDDLSHKLGLRQAEAAQSETQRLAAQKASLDDEIEALEKMVKNVRADPKRDRLFGLQGSVLGAAHRVEAQGLYAAWEWENRAADLKKAREAKSKQLALTRDWSESILPGTEVRPRVTFASEENGAIVQMEMVLGQAVSPMGPVDDRPRWALLDVTSPGTQEKYWGTSSTTGASGHQQAIQKAFQEFADKAAYGRGTIAIDIPEITAAGGKPPVPSTMLMKPGEFGRWQGRLQNLVEIASLVAPFAKGTSLAKFASIGGAADAGYRLYDKALNDRLKPDFETLADVIGLLTPFAEGAGKLAEKLTKTKAGYVLDLTATAGEYANELLMPAQMFHDLEQVINDPQMDPADKKAAAALILGRGLRDKVVQHLGDQHLRSRAAADALAPARPGAGGTEASSAPAAGEHAPGGHAPSKEAGAVTRADIEARAESAQSGGTTSPIKAEPAAPTGRRPTAVHGATELPGGRPPTARRGRLLDDTPRLSKLVAGDPSELRRLAAEGDWVDTMNQLRNATGFAEDVPPLAREAIMDELFMYRAKMVGVLKQFGGEPVGTASTEVISDVDVNFSGPTAGQNLIDAERFMADRYGPRWRENYRMGFMVEATRLVAFEAVPSSPELRREVAIRAETLRAARELHSLPSSQHADALKKLPPGVDRAEVQRLGALGARARVEQRDRALHAADKAATRLQRAVEELQRATSAGDETARAKAERERDAAARELTLEQMLANAMEGDAYIDPAAVKRFVLGDTGAGRPLSDPLEFYGAVRDQLAMITHLVADTPGGIAEAVHRYELLKYINRTVGLLETAGYSDAQLTFLKNWSELGYRVHREATSRDRPAAPTGEDLTEKASKANVRYTDVAEGTAMGPRERISGTEREQLTAFVRDNYEMFIAVTQKYLGELQQKAFPQADAPQATATGAAQSAELRPDTDRRTALGTPKGPPSGTRTPEPDANPAARARVQQLLEARLGELQRPPSKPRAALTAAELAARPRTAEEALDLYDRAVHSSPGREVGLYYDPVSGDFAVAIGSAHEVNSPPGASWHAMVHLHVNPGNVIVRRLPAPADVMGAYRTALWNGRHVEFVQSTRPDGSLGIARLEVTIDPLRIVVDLPADPLGSGQASAPPRRIDVSSPDAYAKAYGEDTTYIEKGSEDYTWIQRDLDDYYRIRAKEAGEGWGRTAMGAGRQPPGTTAGTPATRGADGPAQESTAPARPGGVSTTPDATLTADERARLRAVELAPKPGETPEQWVARTNPYWHELPEPARKSALDAARSRMDTAAVELATWDPQTVWAHYLTGGGYEEIVRGQALRSGGGSGLYGAGESVRAYPASRYGGRALPDAILIEFSAPNAPMRPVVVSHMAGDYAAWRMPAGDLLPIEIKTIRFPNGAVATRTAHEGGSAWNLSLDGRWQLVSTEELLRRGAQPAID